MNPRQALAIEAASAVAARHGLRGTSPRVLDDANNTIVHLAPLPLVAKVCSATARPAGPAALRLELDVASHLVRCGAPVVAPSAELPVTVHREGECALTWWRYQRHDPSARVGAEVAARTLSEVHTALASYPGSLPSFLTRAVRRAGRLLADPSALPALGGADRNRLAAEHVRVLTALGEWNLRWRPLHGDPHRRNFLAGSGGVVMLDFESVCLGPREWDLSALPGGGWGFGGAGGGAVDPELLALLGRLRQVCVEVWCAQRPERALEVAAAA
ncbi:MAG TPA: phosphotransferase [Candidatus Binatia bacterium]|nr:phosphotransferase [Candidatus Binatia bacterium]